MARRTPGRPWLDRMRSRERSGATGSAPPAGSITVPCASPVARRSRRQVHLVASGSTREGASSVVHGMRRLVFGSWPSFTASITFLVIVGLFVVPAECSVAAGPHSLFISPRDIASLQAGNLAHGGHAGAGHYHHGESPAKNVSDDPVTTGDPPTTAELMSDGAAALAVPIVDSALIAPPSPPLVSRDLPIPPDHLRAGPEPPPP